MGAAFLRRVSFRGYRFRPRQRDARVMEEKSVVDAGDDMAARIFSFAVSGSCSTPISPRCTARPQNKGFRQISALSLKIKTLQT
jgi:hypothetical protein